VAHDLNSIRACIKVYSTAKEAESARTALLNAGVRFVWADDTRNDFVEGFCLRVQECDARGAYVRLKAVEDSERIHAENLARVTSPAYKRAEKSVARIERAIHGKA
jgi:hypothetical protein